MLKVGLTGGIGSGKSMVARLFEKLGIPVYYADAEAKRIMNEDPGLKSSLLSLFGNEAYLNGALNRKYIASVVFGNKEKLARLNAIVHPATIADSERWMRSQRSPYAVKEAALIFESGTNKHLDYIIGVSAPASVRTARIMARDMITEEAVNSRMQNQLDEDEKMRLCDSVILNDDVVLVLPQVLALHKKLVEISSESVVENH